MSGFAQEDQAPNVTLSEGKGLGRDFASVSGPTPDSSSRQVGTQNDILYKAP